MSEPGGDPSSGISSGDALILPERHPACRRREARPGFRTERENLCFVTPPGVKGQAASGSNREGESTEAGRRGGAARSSDEGRVMGLEPRGCVVRPWSLANWKREEPVDEAKPFKIPKREVWEAFKRVKANQGAAGVDGQSIAEFEANLSGNLYKLWNRLSSGSYFPPPVRRGEIPKANGGEGTVGGSAGGGGRNSKGEWRDATVGGSDGCGPHRPGGRPALFGADSGTGVPSRFLRLPPRQICDRCRAHSS